jgi:uncharacterized protein
MVKLSIIVAGLVAIAPPAYAAPQTPQASPSFDCASATGQVEPLICKDAGLAALDRRLADVYAAAGKRWPLEVTARQRAIQRGWISGRDDCWKSDDVRACVEHAYHSRIIELQITSGLLAAPTPVGYMCEGGEDQSLFAAFYHDTDPPSAVITYNDDQVIALAAPGESGARYTGPNMEFWEEQGEATVNWYGISLTCHRR